MFFHPGLTPPEVRPLGAPFTPPEKVFGEFWKTRVNIILLYRSPYDYGPWMLYLQICTYKLVKFASFCKVSRYFDFTCNLHKFTPCRRYSPTFTINKSKLIQKSTCLHIFQSHGSYGYINLHVALLVTNFFSFQA